MSRRSAGPQPHGEHVKLPRIVRFLETVSAPDSQCPHCGATGMHIHRFVCEDGVTRAAMSGCVKLYPVSPLAAAAMKLDKKAQDYRKRGYSLPSWDIEKRDALEAFYAGSMSEEDALRALRSADAKASAYRARRGFR